MIFSISDIVSQVVKKGKINIIFKTGILSFAATFLLTSIAQTGSEMLSKETEDLLLRVDLALFRGESEAALAHIKKIEKTERSQLPVLFSYVKILRAQEKSTEAAKLLNKILSASKNPEYVDRALYELGSIEFSKSNFANAESHFTKITKDSDLYLLAQTHLATILYRIGKSKDSDKKFQELKKIKGPHLDLLRVFEAQIAIESGNFQLARMNILESENTLRTMAGPNGILPNSIFLKKNHHGLSADLAYKVQKASSSTAASASMPVQLQWQNRFKCDPLVNSCGSIALDTTLDFALSSGGSHSAAHSLTYSNERLLKNANSRILSAAYTLSSSDTSTSTFISKNLTHRGDILWAHKNVFSLSPFVNHNGRIGIGVGFDSDGVDASVEYIYTKTKKSGFINPILYASVKSRFASFNYLSLQIQYLNPIQIGQKFSFTPGVGLSSNVFFISQTSASLFAISNRKLEATIDDLVGGSSSSSSSSTSTSNSFIISSNFEYQFVSAGKLYLNSTMGNLGKAGLSLTAGCLYNF